MNDLFKLSGKDKRDFRGKIFGAVVIYGACFALCIYLSHFLVNFVIGLLPPSLHEWFKLTRAICWVFLTFFIGKFWLKILATYIGKTRIGYIGKNFNNF